MKLYLGDSVYAESPRWRAAIVLTTENGYDDDPRNRIVMEPEVLDALQLFIQRLQKDAE